MSYKRKLTEPVDGPWIRQAGESAPAYEAFLIYRDMGSDRSLDRAALTLKGGSSTGDGRPSTGRLRGWSSRHDWVARCVAWDNHLQAERDRVAVVEAKKWERRRQAALEANWDTAQAIRSKLDKMLAWPISRQKTSEDGKTIVIEPARWSLATAVLMAKTAAELEAATLIAVGADPDALTDAQARAIIEVPGEAREIKIH